MACLPSTWRPCLAAEGTGLLGALATRGKDFKLRAAAAGTLKACARSRVLPRTCLARTCCMHACTWLRMAAD